MMNSTKPIVTEVVGQRSVFSNYTFLLFRSFFLSGITLASTVFIYRILSVESVSLAAIYVAVLNGITGLFLVWPITGLLQYGREEFDQRRQVEKTFGSTLFIVAILFSISTTVCILLRKPLMGYIGLPTEWLWLLILNTLFIMLNKILIQAFYITASILILSFLDLVEPFLMLIFVGYIWIKLGTIPVTTYLLVSASLSAIVFSFYLFFSRKYIFPFKWSFYEVKRILRFSGFLYGAAIFTFIYDQFHYFIINHFRPTDQLAYYSLAYRIYTFIVMLPLLSVNLIYPIMISYRNLGREDLFQRYSSRILTQMLFFWTMGCIAILLISPWLIPTLFGTVYSYSIPPLSLFCLAAIFQFTIACNSPIIISHERVDWSMKVGLIGTIIIATGNLLLIPPIGIMGAALATLISYIFNSLAYSYLTALLIKERFKGYELVMALFCLPMVLAILLQIPFGIRVVIFVLQMGGMIGWSYKCGVFNTADLFFLDHISIPEIVRKTIFTVFAWLEPRSKVLKNIEP
jgi:O-antigen/teichoic acid export membrane protein